MSKVFCIAYVASTVKANITLAGKAPGSSGASSVDNADFRMPSSLNDQLYANSIDVCKLRNDLLLWPDLDQTEIGERGVSGEHRTRVLESLNFD